MQAAFPDVEKAGAGLILCVKGEAQAEQFAGALFPVILLNDSLKNAMGFNKETVEDPGPTQYRLLVCERLLSLFLVCHTE